MSQVKRMQRVGDEEKKKVEREERKGEGEERLNERTRTEREVEDRTREGRGRERLAVPVDARIPRSETAEDSVTLSPGRGCTQTEGEGEKGGGSGDVGMR
jgi:hypothetical protein